MKIPSEARRRKSGSSTKLTKYHLSFEAFVKWFDFEMMTTRPRPVIKSGYEQRTLIAKRAKRGRIMRRCDEIGS
jgi:hypothetical protein